MRPQGELTSAANLVPFGHVAWGYRDRAEFRARAAEYIVDGLMHNHRILYASDGSRDQLCDELAEMGFADAVRSKQVWVTPVSDYYPLVPGSDVVDPDAAVATGVAVTEQLLAQGYSGCRAVVDGAVLVRTPEQRAAFSRLEFLIDQKMAVLPLAALCAYDLDLLGDTAKELMCLHPFVSKGAVGFRVYADPGAGFGLAGEIDAADNDAFSTALQRIWPLIEGDEPVIDAYGLDFITHRELVAIDRLSAADGRRVILRTDQHLPRRLVDLLELGNIRVKTSPPRLPAAS